MLEEPGVFVKMIGEAKLRLRHSSLALLLLLRLRLRLCCW